SRHGRCTKKTYKETGAQGPQLKLMTIKRILCPTDLSIESDEALRYAVALARAYQAKLIIFHCTPDPTGSGLVNGEAKALLEQSLIPHLGAADLINLDWEGVVGQDEDPGKAISEQAAKH